MESHELSKGDFLYQSDQELFLVVTGETNSHYQFAVHGWREISKGRIDEYLSHQNGKLFTEEMMRDVVADSGSEEHILNFDRMAEMFAEYEDIELSDDGPHTTFALTE